MYRIAVLVASCLALLLAPAPAQAGEPFTVGSAGNGGGLVHGAVNPASGTLTVAWINSVAGSGTGKVQTCRVLRGAKACSAPPQDLTTANGDFGNPYVLINGTNTYVVMQRFGSADVLVWTSSAGGAFAGPVTRAVNSIGIGNSEPVIDSGGNTATIGSTGANGQARAQNFPLTAGQANGTALLADDFGGFPQVGLSGNTPVYAGTMELSSSPSQVGFHRYQGPNLMSSSINDAANWSAINVLGAGTNSRLAGGASGLFLFTNSYRPGQEAPDQFQVRKYDGTNFGAPVNVGGIGAGTFPDFHQTGAGELLAAWGAENRTLRLSRSTNGASFSAPADIVRGDDSVTYPGLDVAAADDGQGFAVWDGPDGAVRVASLEALPPVVIPPVPDTTDPTITSPSIGDASLLPGQGTTFSFVSSEGGSAKLVFQKQVKGLKLKKGRRLRCFASSKKRRRTLRKLLAKKPAVKKLKGKARRRRLAKLVKKRGCKPFKTIGSITQVVTPGRNEIVFTGRIAGRRLSPGTYRARLTVRDLAGNLSSRRVFKFTVVKPRRRLSPRQRALDGRNRRRGR